MTVEPELDAALVRELIAGRAEILARHDLGLDVLRPHVARLDAIAPPEAAALAQIAATIDRPAHELLALDGGLLELLTGAELERSLGLYLDGPAGPVLGAAWALPAHEAEQVTLRPVALAGDGRPAWVFGLPGSFGLAGISASGHAVVANVLRPALPGGSGICGSALLRRLIAAARIDGARAQIESIALADGRNWMLADGLSFHGYEQLGDEQILTRVGRKVSHVHANHCFDPSLRQREARPRSPRSFRRLELASTLYVQRRPASGEAMLAFFDEVEEAAFADVELRASTVLAIELETGRALSRGGSGQAIRQHEFATPLRIGA